MLVKGVEFALDALADVFRNFDGCADRVVNKKEVLFLLCLLKVKSSLKFLKRHSSKAVRNNVYDLKAEMESL